MSRGSDYNPSPDPTRPVALFGGTFDPVHIGHLIIAEHVRDALGLDRLLFMPCREPPHKHEASVTPAADRLVMLERALARCPGFAVSKIELETPGASYTIRTVRELRERGHHHVVLLIGGDSLAELPTWREPRALLEESRVVVVERSGVDLAGLDRELYDRVEMVNAPRVDISSSGIRARVRAGRSIRFLVPESVRAYIEQHGLYAGS